MVFFFFKHFLNYLFLNFLIRVYSTARSRGSPYCRYCTGLQSTKCRVQSTTSAAVGIGIEARLRCLNPEPRVVVSDSDVEPLLVLPIPPHGLPIGIETAV